MTKIIALVDSSIYSHSVCDHAGWIASRMAVGVELLHILGRRDTAAERQDLSGNIALGARSRLLEELSQLDEQASRLQREQGRAILEDATAIIEAAGVTPVTSRLRHGELVENVSENDADVAMVVIGKRGEDADFNSHHLGSNLERIVRSCHKPVFVASRAYQPIQSFLIAFDGGASCLKAVDYVASSPLFQGLACRLLAVGADKPAVREKLSHAQNILEAGGLDVHAEIKGGAPETAISETVKNEGISLLVMGAYGHSHVRNLIIGSTTTEMLRLCPIPVVLFR